MFFITVSTGSLVTRVAILLLLIAKTNEADNKRWEWTQSWCYTDARMDVHLVTRVGDRFK